MINVFQKIVNHPYWGGVILAIVVMAAYAVMLPAPFRSMDDATTIVENEDIRSFSRLPNVFSGGFFKDQSYYRPLVTVSHMIEYAVFGLNSFWFNVNNVLLHILNSLCVFALLQRLGVSRATAYGAAFLFAVHPVHWEAVCNVSGRSILLSAFLEWGAFILLLEYMKRKALVWVIGSLVSFGLALLTKESAALLPIVMAAYFVLVPQKGQNPWKALSVFGVLIVGVFILRRQLGITEVLGWGSWEALGFGFLTFVRGAITYLRLFIFPVDLYFDRSLAVFTQWSDPQLIGAVLFWISAGLLVWRYRLAWDGKFLFFVFWFLIEFAPVSQIVTSIGVQPGYISLAEHFLYLPSVGFLTLSVWALRYFWRLNLQRRYCSAWSAALAVVGIIIFFYLTTIQQAVYASNELAMLKRSVAIQPVNSRVQYSLGMNYVNRAMFDIAEKHFRTAVQIDPWNVRAQIAYGKVLCDQGRLREGIAVYESIKNPGAFAGILQENLRLTRLLVEQK